MSIKMTPAEMKTRSRLEEWAQECAALAEKYSVASFVLIGAVMNAGSATKGVSVGAIGGNFCECAPGLAEMVAEQELARSKPIAIN